MNTSRRYGPLSRTAWAVSLLAFGFLFSRADTALAQSGSGTANQITKWTGANTLGNSVITDNGNIGIGTTSPDKLFVVQGIVPSTLGTMSVIRTTGSNNGFGLLMDATGTGNNNLGFAVGGAPKASFAWDNSRTFLGFANFNYSPNDFSLRVNSDGSLTFHDGSSSAERFRVTAAGNVGIGTTSPGSKLDVNGTVNISSTLTQGGGYGYIGSFNTQTRPRAGADLAVNWNYSGGNRDIDLWNTDTNNSSGQSFVFKQLTGASSHTDLVTFMAGGNVGIGTVSPSAKLHVVGTAYITSNLTVDGNIAAKYQDVAEWVPAGHAISAGTVVVLDPEQSNHVLPSSRAYDTSVAGVVSAKPGVILGEGGEGKVMVATTGRVRVKVDATNAPIRVGDLLVTSDKEGFAMRSQPLDLGGTPIHRPGTLIGKALEPLDKGAGEILVLLSLQ